MSVAEQLESTASNNARPTISAQDWNVLVHNYKKLKEALEAEKNKSAKLRNYIARMNQSNAQKTVKTVSNETAIGLQRLVEEQSSLLDKLYTENREQHDSIQRISRLNRQLLVANDKLRQTLLALKQRIKPSAPLKQDLLPLNQRLQAAEQDKASKTATKDTDKKSKSTFAGLLKELKLGVVGH